MGWIRGENTSIAPTCGMGFFASKGELAYGGLERWRWNEVGDKTFMTRLPSEIPTQNVYCQVVPQSSDF